MIKKLIKLALYLMFASIILLIIVMSIFAFTMCQNQVIESYISPDKKWKVVLFQRDCGATTGFSSQISLIDGDDELGSFHGGGNIYIADGYPKNFNISWETNTSVIINAPKNENFKMEKSLDGVIFHYSFKKLGETKSIKTPNKAE